PGQDALQGRADRSEPGVAEVRLRVGGRVPRRQQQGVALPERNLQRLGQAHHHGPAGDGAPAFDEADVPLRGPGPQREFQLADPAAAAPFAQSGGQPADLAGGLAGPNGAAGRLCLGAHTAVFTSLPASWPFPRGNCRTAAPPAPSKGRNGRANTQGDFMTAIDPGDLVRRYVAVWHEPDAELRRKAVHELWAEDGAQVLQPPEEMRRAAAGLGFPSLVLRARGHEELEARVTRTYHEFI